MISGVRPALDRVLKMTGACMAVVALLGIAWLVLAHVSTLPPLGDRASSSALDAAQARATALGRALAPRIAAHSGESGLIVLDNPRAAYAARMLLARHAQRTIDAQYYIWQSDLTGRSLLAELERAARRGVRVRLLLDDNGIAGLDATLAALAAQTNFEVRLFNPFALRRFKWASYLTDFPRLNHRMHNKSFTVDNQATIVGGRNVGDTYFAAAADMTFADLDLLAVGSVVPDVSSEFDQYWASASAYPIGRIVPDPGAAALEAFHARVDRDERSPAALRYHEALAQDEAVRSLFDGQARLLWANMRLYSDPPDKVSRREATNTSLIAQITPVLAGTRQSFDLVSAYFVPGASGTRDLVGMTQRHVKVRILTNSLAATDVAAVHAGYLKRRKRLLAAGVQLYELSRSSPRNKRGPHRFLVGSSASSLHAKTFAVDGRQLFVGSFNFDPRSAWLNTEMGVMIDSPVLARKLDAAFRHDLSGDAYRLELDRQGQVEWLRREDGRLHRYDADPDASWARRAMVHVLSWLPIDGLL